MERASEKLFIHKFTPNIYNRVRPVAYWVIHMGTRSQVLKPSYAAHTFTRGWNWKWRSRDLNQVLQYGMQTD